jgi:hypothetical protein
MEPPLDTDLFAELAQWGRHDPAHTLVRLAVELRARSVCEYCLMPTTGKFNIEHIVPKHRWAAYVSGRLPHMVARTTPRGPDHIDNFAWSCSHCNLAKSSAVLGRSRQGYARLFDPRRDNWPDHFVFFHEYLVINGVSLSGRATESVLKLNDARLGGPVGPRHVNILAGRYPPIWARGWRADLGRS